MALANCPPSHRAAMAKYANDTEYGLCEDYNTSRGKILDGTRISMTKTVSWKKSEKHGVEDGSIHYKIIQFLEKQPGKRATVYAICTVDDKVRSHPDHYLRELIKQGICKQY